MWVSPFRYPRIIKYLLLPVAFRSLSRLSSALSAKASTLRSYQLNLLTLGAGLLPPSTSIALDAQVLVHNFGFFIQINEVFGKSLDFPPDNTCVFWYLLFWMSLSFIDLDLEHLFNCCIRFSRYIHLLTVLSVIKNQKYFQSLITGKTRIYIKAFRLIF